MDEVKAFVVGTAVGAALSMAVMLISFSDGIETAQAHCAIVAREGETCEPDGAEDGKPVCECSSVRIGRVKAEGGRDDE